MLQDTNTYTIINKDPIKGISSTLKDMLISGNRLNTLIRSRTGH